MRSDKTQRQGWREARVLAQRQFGVITRQQLINRQVGDSRIARLVELEVLDRIETGVFGLPGRERGWRERLFIHAHRTGGVASHLSAALLLGLADPARSSPGFAEVTVGSRARPKDRPKLRVYHSSLLPHDEVVAAGPIPHTAVVPTLLDIAMIHGRRTFSQCFGEAVRLRLVTAEQLISGADTRLAGGRRGCANLRFVLNSIERSNDPLSGWSLIAADLIEADGLPRPELEVVLFTSHGTRIGQVDLYWPEARLVIELDGGTHRSAEAFQRDRRRDALLAAEGITVIRFTWEQYQRDDFLRIVRKALTSR